VSEATASPPPMRGLRIEIAPRTIFLVLGVIACVWLIGKLTAVLMVVTVALVLVGTFDPLVAWLENRGLKRGRALILVFSIAAIAFIAVIGLMVPPLFAQLADLVNDAPKIREKTVHLLEQYKWGGPFVKAAQDIPLKDIGERTGTMMLGMSTWVLEAMGYGLSTLFLAIYLLADPMRSKGLVYSLVPRHHHVKLAKIFLELKVIVGGYMRGQLITSLAIAVFVFALLTIIGADNALALALFAGLTDIIPFVGGYVASTPVIFAAVPHGATITIIAAALMVVYQEFESRILIPRVYGRTLRLPPSIVLIALLVGGTLAGMLGALLALPIAAGLQMVIRELRVDLPGEAGDHDGEKKLDERATEMYEQLTEGSSAAAAGVIADDLANLVKRSEEGGPTLSAQLPTVEAKLDEDAGSLH
jgi:putative heme transporter